MSLLAAIILDDPVEKITSRYYISHAKAEEFKTRMAALLDMPMISDPVVKLVNEIKEYDCKKDHVEMAEPGIQVYLSQCNETNS